MLNVVAELYSVCQEVPEACVVAGRNNLVDVLLALLDASADAVTASCSTLLVLLCVDNVHHPDLLVLQGCNDL